MTLLKDTLNRFRLLGPRAYSVLSSTAVPANVAVEEEEVEGTVECVEVKEAWWRHYYREEGRLQSHQKQVAAWKQLASCSHPPGKVVLPLTVRDPRVMLPTKKVPIVDEDSDRVKPASPEEWPVESAMYSSDLRDQITLSKESDAALNQRRSQFLVPGSQLPETPQEARLPLLLLSRPPTSAGLGSGWDVVTPAGWGMSVFLPLVFSGGVVNGQHEAENLHLEALTSLPPHLLPDTPAGDLHCTWLAAERHQEFFKRPPASRHNYIKLGVQFPFTQPWRKLLQEWQPGILDFFVLREERLLQCLSQLIHNVRKTSSKKGEKEEAAGGTSTSSTDSKTSKTGKGFTYSSSNGNAATTTDTKPEKRKAEDVMSCKETKKIKLEQSQENTQICAAEESVSGETAGMQELTVASPVSLVMVQLVLAHKGTMEPCAMVCLPQDKDFFPDDGLLRLREQGEALKEPLHEDLNHDRRAKMREEHSKIQGRLRRVRRRARQSVAKEMDFVTAAHSTQTLKDATTEALRKVDKENEAILKKHSSYKEEMESAWLMGANDPLQCCARTIMGYITHGTFSYTHGKAAGIGWVALKPLLRLVEQCREGRGQSSLLEAPSRGKCTKSLPVLVRNPSTVQYRWAHLSLVENPPPGSATG
ncbi:Ribonucleases P/MRP protein subunit POP1 [Portunus trituberculatus]|uniref:Ribonucleases P/MRP protein subunit POP1 n=1 Tax=Portunus trituberculatus TaxID=210409 RepID=A0A5B7FPB9_PORTR|nr:Ribonucleases P/MRP protein subunit POP1 [Portunus trituberculatus]